MKLEDAPESTKKLCRFMFKTSNVKRKSGMKDFPHFSKDQEFTLGLFFKYMGDETSPRSIIVIGASIDFKACNKKTFCWGILYMSMTDTLAFKLFKSSTML
jgi:hypothetical protein